MLWSSLLRRTKTNSKTKLKEFCLTSLRWRSSKSGPNYWRRRTLLISELSLKRVIAVRSPRNLRKVLSPSILSSSQKDQLISKLLSKSQAIKVPLKCKASPKETSRICNSPRWWCPLPCNSHTTWCLNRTRCTTNLNNICKARTSRQTPTTWASKTTWLLWQIPSTIPLLSLSGETPRVTSTPKRSSTPCSQDSTPRTNEGSLWKGCPVS